MKNIRLKTEEKKEVFFILPYLTGEPSFLLFTMSFNLEQQVYNQTIHMVKVHLQRNSNSK